MTDKTLIPDADLRTTPDAKLREQAANPIYNYYWRARLLRELAVRRILRSHGKRVIVAAEAP